MTAFELTPQGAGAIAAELEAITERYPGATANMMLPCNCLAGLLGGDIPRDWNGQAILKGDDSRFGNGIARIRDLVGADMVIELEMWLERHPEIWGNGAGHLMVGCTTIAYRDDYHTIMEDAGHTDSRLTRIPVSTLAERWRAVQKRLEARRKEAQG